MREAVSDGGGCCSAPHTRGVPRGSARQPERGSGWRSVPATLRCPLRCKTNGRQLPLKCWLLVGKNSTVCVSMREDHERFLNKLGCGSNSFHLLGRVK